MTSEPKKGSFLKLIKAVFPAYSPVIDHGSVLIEAAQNATAFNVMDEQQSSPTPPPTGLGSSGTSDRDTLCIHTLPVDRLARYRIFEAMANDSSIATMLDIHLTQAFSVDMATGLAFTLQAKDNKDADICKRLQNEVLKPINDNIFQWARATCIFGCNYVHVTAQEKVGIVGYEANYYTLPTNIREYEKCNEVCGFTSENLKKKDAGGNVELAPPWILIPLKLPNWVPSMSMEPIRIASKPFSLYDTIDQRVPVETQNYGVSLLAPCYESWCQVRQAMKSLQASRKNASHIDRFITVNTDGLDTGRAAEYINLITDQLRRDKEQSNRQATRSGIQSTVWNSILPVMGGSKGSISIDTQSVSPDIQHIEDIKFYFHRMCGAAGVEPSLVGFSDEISGGLGDGGFLRNSIQSALKAHLLRTAASKFIQRAIDIHTAFKYSKVWTEETRPYTLKFNSMSTAIANEEETAKETRANYATLVVTVLDAIEQSQLNKSEKFKTFVYENILEIEPQLTEKILSELKAAADKTEQQQQTMVESLTKTIDDSMLDMMIEKEGKN